MISSVRLQNWRGHEDTTVPLQRFTVLVGGNGVGKTSVLEAISAPGREAGIVTTPMRAPNDVTRSGQREAFVEFDGPEAADHTSFTYGGNENLIWTPRRAGISLNRNCMELSLSAKRIAESSPVSHTHVGSDGFGTPSALANLKLTDDQRFNTILRLARRIVPEISDIGVHIWDAFEVHTSQPNVLGGTDQSTKVVTGYKLHVSYPRAPKLISDSVSEGTLLTIGALTAIAFNDHLRVLVIDDIDRALHIAAQAEYVRILREILIGNPKLQIVATTHSPLIVEHFSDDEVVVLGRSATGKVVAKKLSEHPKREKLRSLTSGEFWVAELEHWVAE